MQRYLELDGLRGLAALAVFTTHAFGLVMQTKLEFSWLKMLQNSPVIILWNGHAAVDLFFVLSGFVLALPIFYKPNSFNYLKFAVKRLLRIYPTYWVAIALATLMCYFYDYGSITDLSEWINGYWHHSLTVKETISQSLLHLLLIFPGIKTNLIDPVIWTLIVEMRVSLILPLFIFAIAWKFENELITYVWQVFILFAALILSLKLNDYLFFLPLFLFGSFAAFYKDKVIKLVRQHQLLSYLFLAIAIYLYGSRYFITLPLNYQHHYLSALGSSLIILIVIGNRQISQLITKKAILFLGHISYSFYLIHLPISIILSSLIYPHTKSILLCWIAILLSSIYTAYLLNKYIEIPCQKIGRKLNFSSPSKSLV